MNKVKEYLDINLFAGDKNSIELKDNGHCCVHGYWEYPINISKDEDIRIKDILLNDPTLKTYKPNDQIQLIINNETMLIRMIIINGVSISKYGYLQTYEHIPRGEPDNNGYYQRSTDEEIIKYIDGYLKQIKENERQNI